MNRNNINKNESTISVIVPVYNGERYLHECIDSILNQSFTDFELILVDDGSKDSSAQICDDYAKRDHRVRVIHKQNEGIKRYSKTWCTGSKRHFGSVFVIMMILYQQML